MKRDEKRACLDFQVVSWNDVGRLRRLNFFVWRNTVSAGFFSHVHARLYINLKCRDLKRSSCRSSTQTRVHAGFFFVHLDQNSGPRKTQVFGETQVFPAKTQVFFPKNSGIRKLFFVLSTIVRFFKNSAQTGKLRYSDTFVCFWKKSAQKAWITR